MPNKTRHTDLTQGALGHHLISLTLPTIGGMLAIIVFNITDTFFVARLGTDALAAMGFTFPVVMFVGTLAMGVGSGTTSVLSRALGAGDHHLVRRVATDGLFMVIVMVIILGSIGLLTMDPLFTMLGAGPKTLPLVKEYMTVWYWGIIAAVMPGVSDGCLRATGDMKRPLIVMTLCATLNLILDPLLIFGYWGFPKMGITGAAVATIISRLIATSCSLYFVYAHARMIDFTRPKIVEMIDSWKRILHVGGPAAISQLVPIILRGLLTKMAASVGGAVAVAAIAAGSRIESLGLIITMAYGTALMPIAGQNWGARKFDRVNDIRKISNRFSWIYGIIVVLIAYPLAPYIATIFTENSEVLKLTTLYVRIIAFTYLTFNILPWTTLQLNAVGKPLAAMMITAVGTAVIVMPATVAGWLLYDFAGMLIGLVLGQAILAVITIFWGRTLLCPHRATIAHRELSDR